MQGSRKRPYDVEISVQTIDAADWERLRQALAEQPVIAASLLAGRMPENIEDTFKAVGLSMFPTSGDDLETDCSCPDWSNPCKHIAAIYLLLGEEFDRDPFLIFRIRGMDREDLLGEEFRQSAQTIDGPPRFRLKLRGRGVQLILCLTAIAVRSIQGRRRRTSRC